VTIVTLPVVGGPPATSHTFVSLDSVPPAPLGKPFSLSFGSAGGAVICGTLTDDVSILNSNGTHFASWNLPVGSIPRGVLFDEAAAKIYVYCWGTNKIEVRDTTPPGLPKIVDLDLGYDPTSELRKEGRRIFYDGKNSLNQNLSCESCHIEGMFDHLVWNLSGTPIDDKGVLFTQSLKGIEFTKPYHWRGERELFDFNGAFSGLLGGTNLTPTQFEAFEEFVFGLQNPANPFEHPRRVVSDRHKTGFDFDVHPTVSAVRGQELYFAEPSVGNDSCNDCHTLPTGTNNDFFPDELDDTGHRNTFKNTAFNGLWRKEQKTRVQVKEHFGPAEMRPPLGAGASHAGLANGVFEFNLQNFDLPSADEEDIAFFVHQVDQGIAPAVHRAVLVSPASPNPPGLSGNLVPQAKQRNCDLVVIGPLRRGRRRAEPAGTGTARRLFRSEDRISPRGHLVLQPGPGRHGHQLVRPCRSGWGGASRRPDMRLLFRQDELQLARTRARRTRTATASSTAPRCASARTRSAPRACRPPPRCPRSRVHEAFHTCRVAKLMVEADRPVKIQVDYASSLGDVGQFVENVEFKTMWEVALRDLKPSRASAGIHRAYTGTITVTDEFGHTAQTAMPSFETLSFTDAFEFGVAHPILSRGILRDPDLLGGHARRRRRVRLLRRARTNTASSISGANGVSTFTFRLPNSASGDRIQLSIEMVGRPVDAGTFDPRHPQFDNSSLFDLANTPAACRASAVITLP
jgi:hypothetical protein